MNSAYTREYPMIYKGIVESNEDPDRLGRCKIRVPAAHGELNYSIESLPWAKPIVGLPSGSMRGSSALPDVGDIVWIMFEGGKKDYPLYFGGTYTSSGISDKDKIIFYVENSNSITYDRKSNNYTINIGENSITVSSSGIVISGDTTISGDISLNGNTQVSGNMSVSGTLSVGGLSVSGSASISNLNVGSCNKEGTHVG